MPGVGMEIGQVQGWRLWRSQAGRWWATRLGDIKPSNKRPAKWYMTIDADTEDELLQKIEDQKAIRDDAST
jgi:hypothetical protein